MYDLLDLIRPLSSAEVEAEIYSQLDAKGIAITSWKSGSVARTLISTFSTFYSYGSYMIALIAQSGFVELSTGRMLDLTARHVYGLERLSATFGQGTLTLHNTSGSQYDFSEGDLVATGATGYEYTGSAVSLLAGSTTTLQLEAKVSGSAPNLPLANQIVRLATPLPGVDIVSSTPITGLDAELDPALRARCRGKLSSLSINGPADSFRFFAVSATRSDGTSCGVTDTRITKDGRGNVTLYVASGTGSLADDDLAIVTTAAKKARTICDNLTVVNANAFTLNVAYTIYAYSSLNMTDDALWAVTDAKLAARVDLIPIGGDAGYIYTSSLAGAIQSAYSQIYRVDITFPGGSSVAMADNDLAILGAVTHNPIVWTPVPEGAAIV